MTKILITGANGLLGQKLVELIGQNSNYELIATARGANRLKNEGQYKYLEMDITNQLQVNQVMAAEKPQVVIHTAAMTNVDQCESEKELCWAMNVSAVDYLKTACQTHNIFLIHVSTDFIFDGLAGPYDENANASPLSYYGESKLAAENILLNSTIKYAIARTVLVYGITNDMSRTNIILWVKKSLEDGKTINVVTDQYRTPTLAEDLATGCFLMAQKQISGIFNISGKDFLTPYEMAVKTANYFALDKALIKMANSSTFSQPAKRPAKTGFIIDKAIALLGYKPHSFDEGIAIVAQQVSQINN